MAYGQGEYGQSPYGGSELESTGPVLVSSDPADASTVFSRQPISFVLGSSTGLDLTTLVVLLNGNLAVSDDDFEAGYTGTVVQNPESQLVVTILTHPLVATGDTTFTVDITIKDLAGNAGTFSFSFTVDFGLQVTETVTIIEDVEPGQFTISGSNGTVTVTFPVEFTFDRTADFRSYILSPVGGGYPVTIQTVEPQYDIFATGSSAQLVDDGDPRAETHRVKVNGQITTSNIGDFLALRGATLFKEVGSLQIVGIVSTSPALSEIIVDKPLPVLDPDLTIDWEHTSGVQGVIITTTKMTNGAQYLFSAVQLTEKLTGRLRTVAGTFIATATKPKLETAEFVDGAGSVLVTFDQTMRYDSSITNPGDFSLTGPTTVTVQSVVAVNTEQVLLQCSGLSSGNYTLTVSTSTPKDIAGNPLDPTFNTAIFFSSFPLITRSIYTDKGPIAKPPLTLQSGISATLDDFDEVTLPGAVLTPSHIGLMVRLSGGVINGGDFKIASVLSATKARVKASFTLPDPSSGSLVWALIDPRNGQIADDPADVAVRVNGFDVTPDAVIGLLGQIVLPTVPASSDDVEADYHWICNPCVDFRRLNSKEFRLNAWDRDVGYPDDPSQHHYRYNNALIQPSSFVADDIQSDLAEPLLRELHYRAYERAYTALLNDPNLLVLNTPINKIAYPPSVRMLSEQFVQYEALTLPENGISNPWVRKGGGTASVSLGVLTVDDDSTGVFPTGQPIFWTRNIDLSFPTIYALSWRFSLDVLTTPEGVWTGVAAGYSDERAALVLGYLDDGGTKKVGILKRGSADDPSSLSAWTGGLDGLGNPTGLPVDLDWSILHSYRLYRSPEGVLKVFFDGDIIESLRVSEADLPFLEELNAPFDEIQGVFFGSLSRPARSTSSWDFVRYLIQPTNPQQTSPSSFVSYEANVPPEEDAKPWTQVGFHGTETIQSSDFLLLDDTSASDVSVSDVGNFGSDYRGFVRLEPLLSSSSQVVLDVGVRLQTFTHGVDPNGLMAAVDDGARLMQLCFFPDQPSPKFSYGGRSFPEDFSPYVWSALGSQTAEMAGRILKITDTSLLDGKVYFIDDTAPVVSSDRVVGASIDSILEFRAKVESYTADGSGFAGVFAQAFDGTRAVGMYLLDIAGTKYVAFTSDGVSLGVLARFVFNWDDGEFHTYRASKSTTGDLVSLFVDGTLVGTFPYSSFLTPPPDPQGQISFGSSTPSSSGSMSVVFWAYCNAWRITTPRTYVGIWKGADPNELAGYHLPLKASGTGAQAVGNALGDTNASFLADGVVPGDLLVVDVGSNKGTYEIAAVGGPTALTIVGTWPASPTLVDYRIAKETDWTVQHKYRLSRDSTGDIILLFDADPNPLVQIGYNDLPLNYVGALSTISGGLPVVAFGSFNAENLAQSRWDFVRYGLTRSPTEQRIVPHHEVLNQWNVMASPEHLFTSIPHSHTSFKSSSTGIPPQIDPDFLEDPALAAFTQLNEGTPLVPRTQTFEVRAPFPTQQFVSTLNNPEDVLNNDGDFTLNDGSVRFTLIVPDDVLYNSLAVIEQEDGGQLNLIAPFTDDCGFLTLNIDLQKEVCLEYDADVLPEDDTAAPTPWALVSDTPAQVSTSAFSSVLTYSTGVLGTRTVYRNDTPLPDAPSMQTEARFRVKVLTDSTGGTGDSQIRMGLSAPGFTVGLGFVTSGLGERYVLAFDLNTGLVVGARTFDFLDGAYHVYVIVRDPSAGLVSIFIDP